MNSPAKRLLLVLALTSFACATAQPPPALSDARTAYQDARHKAAQRAPVELDEARIALDAAESEFRRSAGSPSTVDLAYIAKRRAQLAMAVADRRHAEAMQAKAEKEYSNIEARMYDNTREELQRTSGTLADTEVALEYERRRSQDLAGAAAESDARATEATKRAEAALARLARTADVSRNEKGTVISLSGEVLFSSGESEILPTATRRLEEVADALKAQEESSKVVIEGHTDSRGDASFNRRLSRARAESVRQFLIQQGVDGNALTVRGMGEDQPIASNATPEGRANNRRVEIILED